MVRTAFILLMIASTICFSLITSLKQRHYRNLRKTDQNPYHPEDVELTDLLDFSPEDSDYFVQRFGRFSEEGTTIIDKRLKINGRHFNLQKSYDVVERLRVKRRKHH